MKGTESALSDGQIDQSSIRRFVRDEWQRSGETQAAFARRLNLPKGTFEALLYKVAPLSNKTIGRLKAAFGDRLPRVNGDSPEDDTELSRFLRSEMLPGETRRAFAHRLGLPESTLGGLLKRWWSPDREDTRPAPSRVWLTPTTDTGRWS